MRSCGSVNRTALAAVAVTALSLVAVGGAWGQLPGGPAAGGPKPSVGAGAGTSKGTGTSTGTGTSSTQPAQSSKTEAAAAPNTVSGIVTDAAGKPLAKATVKAYRDNKDPMAKDTLIGQDDTDAAGKYSIAYKATGTPITLPNVYIEVYTLVGGKQTKAFTSDTIQGDPRKGIAINAALGGGGAAAGPGPGSKAAAPGAGSSGGSAPATGGGKATIGTSKGVGVKMGAAAFKSTQGSFLASRAFAENQPWPKGENDKQDLSKIKGSEYLGRGYDVYGAFGSATACRKRVLDIAKMNEEQYLDSGELARFDYDEASGSSLKSFQEKLAGNIGVKANYACFSGETNVAFGKETSQTTAYSYYKFTALYTDKWVRIPQSYFDITNIEFPYRSVRVQVLQHYLTPDAKTAIETGKPEKLFSDYGSYVLVGMVNGARLNYNVQTKSTEFKQKDSFSISTSVKAQMGIAGASVNAGFSSEKERQEYESASTRVITAVGGNQNLVDLSDLQHTFGAWRESIEGKEQFCGFIPERQVSLIPIWLLASKTDRRSDLEDYYMTEWAKKQFDQFIGAPAQKCIVDLRVKQVKKGQIPDVDNEGYIRLPMDLNAGTGAGGSDIYIYYKLGLDDGSQGAPVTEIYINNTDHNKAMPFRGGKKIETSLNAGSKHGGDDIYLCYKQENGKTPIRAICVENLSHQDKSPSAKGIVTNGKTYDTAFSQGAGKAMNWTFLLWPNENKPFSLNAGASEGDNQWLGYSTDYIAVATQ